LYVDGKLMQMNGAVHGFLNSEALGAGINSQGNSITLTAGPHLVYVEKFSSTANRNLELCAIGYWAGPDTVAVHAGWGPGTFPGVIFGSVWPAFRPVDFAPGGCIKLDGKWTDPSGATVTISGGGGQWNNGRPAFIIAPGSDCNTFKASPSPSPTPRSHARAWTAAPHIFPSHFSFRTLLFLVSAGGRTAQASRQSCAAICGVWGVAAARGQWGNQMSRRNGLGVGYSPFLRH
jgi:hypothetical protein